MIFSMEEYDTFVAAVADETAAFRARQKAATAREDAREAARASDGPTSKGSSAQRQPGKRSFEEDAKPAIKRGLEDDERAGEMKSTGKRPSEDETCEADRDIDSGSRERHPAKRARLAESEGRTRAVRWCS